MIPKITFMNPETEKAIFTNMFDYELAELTMRNMLHAYEQGVLPLQCLLDTAFATWTDDALFSARSFLKPKSKLEDDDIRKLIKKKFPDLSSEEVGDYVDAERGYQYNINSDPRRYYVATMYNRKHGIEVMKTIHPEWEDSINAYVKYKILKGEV